MNFFHLEMSKIENDLFYAFKVLKVYSGLRNILVGGESYPWVVHVNYLHVRDLWNVYLAQS